jgi:SnoaL-like domain
MSDTEEITQLIMRERQGRDRAWWEQMRATLWPEMTLRLSWIDGTGTEFVDGSRAMAERSTGTGALAGHRLGLPSVHVGGDRAVTEVALTINSRIVLGGVETDMATYLRLLYQTEKRNGRWGILRMDAIYETDTMTPAVPGQTVNLDPAVLEGRRPSYRLLSYQLEQAGISVPDDLYGVDQPGPIRELYRSAFKWAGIDHPDLAPIE